MTSTPGKTKPASVHLLTGVLWLLCVAAGLAAIYSLYEIALTIFALFSSGPRVQNTFFSGVLVGQVTVFIASLAWLVAIVMAGEYSLKHSGEPGTWRLFGWMLGIEMLIVLVGAILA